MANAITALTNGDGTGHAHASGDIVGMLESAVRGQRTVMLSVADKNGHVSERIVRPIRLDEGTLHAVDPDGVQAYRFTVERIAGVSPP